MEEHLAEQMLTRKIRPFLKRYADSGRPVELIDGAWKVPAARTVSHRAAAKTMFAELRTEPVLLLESELVGSNLDIHYAFWDSAWPQERYETAMSFSWREALCNSAKERARLWQERTAGESEDELLDLYGPEAVRSHRENLKIVEREKLAAAKGLDPASIERHYSQSSIK